MSEVIQKDTRPHKIENPLGDRLQKRLYNEKEAAVYLGRTVWAIREIRYAGNIPFVSYGRSVRYDIKDLDAWIEKNKTQFTY